jgi:hypothetical protein
VTVGRRANPKTNQSIVVVDVANADPVTVDRMAGRRVDVSCFQIQGPNIRHTRTAGISSDWKPKIAYKILGYIRPPFDGCQMTGRYGHRWPDLYGSHSPVEIPLTDRGRAYFAHRAAARDLALFVRSARTQRIRKLTGTALIAAIRREYGDKIRVLSDPEASAPPETVAIWTSGTRTIFSERSTAGARFYVEFRNGKITRQNLRGVALVF